MTGFLGKLFGGKKKRELDAIGLAEELLHGLIERAGLQLAFDVKRHEDKREYHIDIFGEDEELLLAKDGALLDAFQLFIRRSVQHQLPEDDSSLAIDCAGFREQANEALIELAEKLKESVIEKGKSAYVRALPPKDRKVVHQYLAEDGRVKSRSIGEGHFKKIKIYPAKNGEFRDDRAP